MLKNALDWLVGGEEMVRKPVSVINTSPHATHAWNALLETLRTMSAHLVDDACIAIALPRNRADEELAADPAVAPPLRTALACLIDASRR